MSPRINCLAYSFFIGWRHKEKLDMLVLILLPFALHIWVLSLKQLLLDNGLKSGSFFRTFFTEILYKHFCLLMKGENWKSKMLQIQKFLSHLQDCENSFFYMKMCCKKKLPHHKYTTNNACIYIESSFIWTLVEPEQFYITD